MCSYVKQVVFVLLTIYITVQCAPLNVEVIEDPRELESIRADIILGKQIYESITSCFNCRSAQYVKMDSHKEQALSMYKFYSKSWRQRNGGNVICFPVNRCVNISDIGIHP
ncbi:uncharacterized protein LOC109598864 [Aethina tumida]|uniref:uncharacterized protein LOC109598864 n=1 Tax=Aethina tumida TaxID=116153 RepID=UPI00096B1311|nr:uncharacterized protein LOC109598864 [Aethina tumida]XP_019870342.1 uncharacterized protein LOC109598864 [Aethina tumida]